MSKFWHTEEEIEATMENYHRTLDSKEHDFKIFLINQFNKLHTKMQIEVQKLIDSTAAIGNRVESLIGAFNGQTAAIADLKTQLANAGSLSDADKATLATAASAVDAETAKISAILTPAT